MLRRSSSGSDQIAAVVGINPILASILASRGVRSPEAVKKFMFPSLQDLHNPQEMKDMNKGVELVTEYIKADKKIVIYGDYDVDGVMSTVILLKALKRWGANVSYHIPDREAEGYGMNLQSVELLYQKGCQMILTCDNGIAAVKEIKRAKELGMAVVIVDHHEVSHEEDAKGCSIEVLPPADAVIDPKQAACPYPFKLLCAGAICFKFAQVLYRQMGGNEQEAAEFIEYASIATVCDVVDLVEENRIIVAYGLEMLNQTKNVGLAALIKETGLYEKKIDPYHVGFVIGPCINATGRLELASGAVELLLAQDIEQAEPLAKKLRELNVKRQSMTSEAVEKVVKTIESRDIKRDKVLVIYEQSIHESIAGIVAGRIKERYYLPTIVLTEGKEMPKGSGRSIEGYNMFEELLRCKELLHKFGGHPMAAGLSLQEHNIDFLRKQLNESCTLTEDELTPKIRIDQPLPPEEITFELIHELKKLAPFGKGNASPLFAQKNILIQKINILGKEKNVLKLLCTIQNSKRSISAISFDGVEKFQTMISQAYDESYFEQLLLGRGQPLKLDMIFSPEINTFNGTESLQMIIKDFRLCK